MYRLYTTEAIVLGSTHAGEANSYFFLLTRELGLVKAFAQGVRELKSKLRYNLEQYALVQVSLIRGKEKWRITNALKLSAPEQISRSREKVKLCAKLCALVQRLVHGEEVDAELFDELKAALTFLSHHELSAGEQKDYELLAVLRLLDCLGYISPRDGWLALLDGDLWSNEALPNISDQRRSLLQTINEALYHSQL